MINQFRFFNEFITFNKKRTIKIEEKILYSNQCETIIIKIKIDENRLTKVFYVFDFDVNFLFDKRFIKKN